MMRARLFIPVLGLGQVVAFASSYYLLGVLADPMAADLGMTTAQLFAALSAAFLISAVLTPLGGLWIERYGGRSVLAGSSAAFCISLIGMACAPGPWAACAAIASLGGAMAVGLYGAAFATVVEVRGAAARTGITLVSLIGAMGGAVGWPVSRMVVEAADWRVACLVWAGLHVGLCLPLTLAVLPGRAKSAARSQAVSRAAVEWDGRMRRLAVLFAGAWAVATAMGAHMPRLLGELGLDVSAAAWAAGLMALTAIGARLLDLLLLRKAHPVLTARLACLCHPAGASAALLGGTGFAPLLAVGQGAGNGLLSVASGVLPLTVFGPDRYAVRQSLLLTPARYVQAAAPGAYALAMDVSATTALLLSSAVCLLMAAATFGLRAQAQA